jgi:N-methylhydantoinase A/oxoprolinase/acetone carboxylase beta subunit
VIGSARDAATVRLGVDTGGTFTDVVRDDGSIAKVSSTPDNPAAGVAAGVHAISESTPSLLAHGTTVATNALLERRGARVALIATRGFADVIEIARQARPSLYDPFVDRPAPLVPRTLRFEVNGRLDGAGRELEPWDGELPSIPDAVDAIAVCLLHADLNPAHEQAVATALRSRGCDVTASHEVSPEFREYERMVTTVTNAYLRPACAPYLGAIESLAGEVLVMTSAGGLVPVDEAARVPAALLLSGPAGGARAGGAVAAACGFPNAVTFDMGGTSTDVCLVQGGVPEPAAGRRVAGLPVRLPALDVHTIGAGGGSIAAIDAGGALVVGPRSAGARPGPACYGRGGLEPTVTDADLVLGRIPSDTTLSDLGALDITAARAALERAGVSADGVAAVVDAAMEEAVRAVTVARGVNPRDVALVAFGGAGPLHACAVAAALGMPAVIVPPRAGVLSAVGLLCSPRRRELVRSVPAGSADAVLDEIAQQLGAEARRLVGDDADVSIAYDCRYEGQSHELTVASPTEFPAAHATRNGHAREGAPIEVIALRARAVAHAPLDVTDLPEVSRGVVRGPTVIAESDCTVWVPEGWEGKPGALGSLVLERR